MIRRRPSTTVVSLPSTFMLSRVWALASSFSASLNLFAFIWDLNLPMACSMSRCAYQTSRNGCPAKPRIAVRYASAAARTILRRALPGNPLSRPATARLAASRLTSHSNGPGRVSSKSLTSKTRLPLRRGERAEIGQVRVPAQLHPQTGGGRGGQVRRHRQRRPPVERERRHQHPPVPDRHQLRHPRLRLPQQQPDRIPRPARGELRMRLQRGHRPGILTPGHPVRATQLLHRPGPR